MHINAGLFTLALAGFNSLAAAQPHKPHLHARHHLKGRNVVTEFITKTVDQNGNLYSTSVPTPTLASASALAPVPDTTSTSVVTATLASASSGSYAFSEESYSSSFSSYSSSSHYSRTYSSSQSEATSVAAPDNSDALAGIDKEFPDGELDCSTFPSDYGAISLPWVTKDGWSSIQINGGNGDSIGKCTEGALCSYACPPGYSKAQWPALQPASGESHGGLECKGGKLYRTRDDFTKLCEVGAGTAKVINKLGDYVAICRTDYPGKNFCFTVYGLLLTYI